MPVAPRGARAKAGPCPGRIVVAALLALAVSLCVSSAALAASPSMEPCPPMEPGKAGSLAYVTLWNLLAGLPVDRASQIDPPEAPDYLPVPDTTAQVPDRYLTPRWGRAPPLA